MIDQGLGDRVLVFVGCNANLVHHGSGMTGIASVLVACEPKVNKAYWDAFFVRCKNQSIALKERFAENALVPNAYWANAFRVKRNVVVMPKLG